MKTIHDLALSHYTNQSGIAPFSVDQRELRGNGKPNGLWVSVDGEDDWPAWCDAEDYELGANHFGIVLAREANVLLLSGMAELEAFTAEFGFTPEWSRGLSRRSYDDIQWDKVAEKYQGIIIAPYCWRARRDLFWYSGWDVASGCIWDAAAIQAVMTK